MIVHVLFESVWLLCATWVAVQFLLVCIWSWRRTKPTLYTLGAGFAVLPILLCVSAWVVTDRERIIQTCRDMASYVEACNLSGIEYGLAEDFEMAGRDKDQFLKRLEMDCRRVRISDVGLGGFDVSFGESNVGVASFRATARIQAEDLAYQWYMARWRLTFVESGERWLLSKAERLSREASQPNALQDLMP